MEVTFIPLNTNDLDKEFEHLQGALFWLVMQKDYKKSVIDYFKEKSVSYINPHPHKIKDNRLYINENNIKEYYTMLSFKEKQYCQLINNFLFRFENKNLKDCLIKLSELLKRNNISIEENKLQLIISGFKEEDILNKINCHINNLFSHVQEQLKLRYSTDEKDLQIQELIKCFHPILIHAFKKFEEELINGDILSVDRKWIGKKTDLARLIKALETYGYLKTDPDFKKIRFLLKDRYKISYSLNKDTFKPSKIKSIDLTKTSINFERLELLKTTHS